MEIVQHRVINTIGVPWKFNEVVNAEGLQYNCLKRRILWNFNSGEYENKGWKKLRLIRRSHKSLELSQMHRGVQYGNLWKRKAPTVGSAAR
jgi:hypothetical protein